MIASNQLTEKRMSAVDRAAVALSRRARKPFSIARRCWEALRRTVGDDAYERYLEHHAAHHAGVPALGRRAYYLDRQRRKWEGVERCC